MEGKRAENEQPTTRTGFDVVGFGETMLRLGPPHGERLEDARALRVHVAGAESNALCCASRLGLRCAWLSALPNNPLGRMVAGELRRHGVDTSGVAWSDEAARVGTFYAEEAPEPAGTRVYYDRSGSALATLDPDAVDYAILSDARTLLLGGITPALGSGPREAFSRLLYRARESGVRICFDVNYRAKLWSAKEAAAGMEEACRVASLLVCSRDDAATLWGFTGEPEEVLRRMADRFGSEKTLVLTMGGEGSAELRGGEYAGAPASASVGAHRFGSGDAFTAAYLFAWLEGSGYAEAEGKHGATPLLMGNAAAALKRSIPGDIATVTLDEVLGVLRGGEGRFR